MHIFLNVRVGFARAEAEEAVHLAAIARDRPVGARHRCVCLRQHGA